MPNGTIYRHPQIILYVPEALDHLRRVQVRRAVLGWFNNTVGDVFVRTAVAPNTDWSVEVTHPNDNVTPDQVLWVLEGLETVVRKLNFTA